MNKPRMCKERRTWLVLQWWGKLRENGDQGKKWIVPVTKEILQVVRTRCHLKAIKQFFLWDQLSPESLEAIYHLLPKDGD